MSRRAPKQGGAVPPIHASLTLQQRLNILRGDPQALEREKQLQASLRRTRAEAGSDPEAPVSIAFEVMAVPELKHGQGLVLGSCAFVPPRRTRALERRQAVELLRAAGFEVAP